VLSDTERGGARPQADGVAVAALRARIVLACAENGGVADRVGLRPQAAPGRDVEAGGRPQFIAKVRDVVGLCVSPPEHALALAVTRNRRSRRWTARPRACPSCRPPPRFHPTRSSRLNLERWFAELVNRKLRRSAHRGVIELKDDIRKCINGWNKDPKPFAWTKTAYDVRGHSPPTANELSTQNIRAP
jgi:hypothetical protein